ncbi:MAG: hypothetical protein M1561_02075 [Gammaproteobacteria bacterium]|nr:hypothetical protein [Gammaproteobacteria bacterium]
MVTTPIIATSQLSEEKKRDEERGMAITPITDLRYDSSRRFAFQDEKHLLRSGELSSAERRKDLSLDPSRLSAFRYGECLLRPGESPSVKRNTKPSAPPPLAVSLFRGGIQIAAKKAAAETAKAMARTQTAQRSVAVITASSTAALAASPPVSSDDSASFLSLSPIERNGDDEDNVPWAPHVLSPPPDSKACYPSKNLAQAQSQASALHSGVNGSVCGPPLASTPLNNNTDVGLMLSAAASIAVSSIAVSSIAAASASIATASILSFFSSRSVAVSSNAKEQNTPQGPKNESSSSPSPVLAPEPCQCILL